MALVFVDRVKVRTQTSGLGTITLGNAVEGFQSFAPVGSGNETYYAIVDNRGNWEVGRGTYTAITVDSVTTEYLARDTVLSSSNAGAKINFLAGAKNVFNTYPASAASSLFAGPGAATSAGYANLVEITADNTTNVTNYALFVNAATGNLSPRTDTAFTYNPFTGTLSTTTFAGALTGNATTATTLQTARLINGTSFNGSADVTVTAAAGTLTGTTLNPTVLTSSLTSVGTLTNLTVTNTITGKAQFSGAADTLAATSTITNATFYPMFSNSAAGNITAFTGSGLTFNPSTGDLTATSFSGPLNGNADTATVLQTSRNINGVAFNGSADINIGFPIRAYQKTSDVTASGTVAFSANAYISTGTSFGTMAATGVFTFSRAGTYQVTVTFNVSADPDAWGGINGTTGTRYNQVKKGTTGAYIGSTTDIISVSSGETYEWKTNNLVIVYGSTNTTATRIQFTQLG